MRDFLIYNDYASEPEEPGSTRLRCVHCKRSTHTICRNLQGHAEDCLYRITKERGYEYKFIPFDRAPEETEGPTAEDGPDEEGFRGPRPWNNYGRGPEQHDREQRGWEFIEDLFNGDLDS